MPRFTYDIGIIGGGSAGLTMAAGAARLGARVLLIDAGPELGGDCLHRGCVPSKALIRCADAYHQAGHLAGLGLPPAQRPPVDFAPVARRIAGVIARIQPHDSARRFRDMGVDVRIGRASFADEHCVEVGGARLDAAKWLICTGSSPAVPPVPGLEGTPFITSDGVWGLERLPASLAVLGGGPIAVELAQALARLGCRVVLAQRSGRILGREDPDMAEVVRRGLEADGVEVLTGAKVRRAAPATGGVALSLDTPGGPREIRAEALLAALGRRPNLDGLGLDRAGVAHGPKGVTVDSRMRTSQKHIFAAGDITGRHLFTHAAAHEAGVALAGAVMRLPRRADYDRLSRCTFSRPELASVGLNEQAAAARGLPYRVIVERFAENDRAVADGRPEGMLKLLLGRRDRVLGCQIAGAGAGELIGHWVAAMAGRLGPATLAGAIHPYPTLGEISKRAAARVVEPRLFSPMVRKALNLVFGLGRRPGL